MQLAFAAIGKVFAGLGLSGAAAGTAGAAGAATGAATTAAAGSGALGALQGFSTVLKVLGGIGAASASARADNQAADQAELQAGQEQLGGEQRKTKMTRELARVLGNNSVAFAAAGIDLSQGIAADNAAQQKQRAATEISIDQQDTEFRRALLRQRAAGLRDRAKSTKGGALLGALGDVAGYGMSLAERG
ncbi:hypothetical protein ACRQ1B_06070 [Rhizobium panacihumi]|uniref:hypothetical protein n=1 Tax=Rhizobium panacihumi TaxID=2008450 RepID=UPI003D7AEE61